MNWAQGMGWAMSYDLVKNEVSHHYHDHLVTITSHSEKWIVSEEVLRDWVWTQFPVLPQELHTPRLDGNILAQ